MTRGWIGLALLLALMVGSLVSVYWLQEEQQVMGTRMEQAAGYALESRQEDAQALPGQVKRQWERNWNRVAAFADHGPMEEIDGDLELLELYCEAREEAAFAAESCRLARKIAAMGEAHEFVWWNIL